MFDNAKQLCDITTSVVKEKHPCGKFFLTDYCDKQNTDSDH